MPPAMKTPPCAPQHSAWSPAAVPRNAQKCPSAVLQAASVLSTARDWISAAV